MRKVEGSTFQHCNFAIACAAHHSQPIQALASVRKMNFKAYFWFSARFQGQASSATINRIRSMDRSKLLGRVQSSPPQWAQWIENPFRTCSAFRMPATRVELWKVEISLLCAFLYGYIQVGTHLGAMGWGETATTCTRGSFYPLFTRVAHRNGLSACTDCPIRSDLTDWLTVWEAADLNLNAVSHLNARRWRYIGNRWVQWTNESRASFTCQTERMMIFTYFD